jgi:hypothetical protein
MNNEYITTLLIKVKSPVNIPDVAIEVKRLGYKIESFIGILGHIVVDGNESDIDKLKDITNVESVSINTSVRDLFNISADIQSIISKM